MALMMGRLDLPDKRRDEDEEEDDIPATSWRRRVLAPAAPRVSL